MIVAVVMSYCICRGVDGVLIDRVCADPVVFGLGRTVGMFLWRPGRAIGCCFLLLLCVAEVQGVGMRRCCPGECGCGTVGAVLVHHYGKCWPAVTVAEGVSLWHHGLNLIYSGFHLCQVGGCREVFSGWAFRVEPVPLVALFVEGRGMVVLRSFPPFFRVRDKPLVFISMVLPQGGQGCIQESRGEVSAFHHPGPCVSVAVCHEDVDHVS